MIRLGWWCAAAALALSTSALAQSPAVPPPGMIPPGPPGPPALVERTGPFDPHDLSGVWRFGFAEYVDHNTVHPPLTPRYQKMMEEHAAAAVAGQPFADTVSTCQAFGMPRVMTFGNAEILQTPGRVTIITETLHEVRRIWIDGRTPPADLDPSFEGYATGHWEGDTLVVDTVGVMANTIDQYGMPMSDKLKVHERIRRVAPDRIENEITLDDPEALTQKFTVTKTYVRLPEDTDFGEYICTSNNRNGVDKAGRQTDK